MLFSFVFEGMGWWDGLMGWFGGRFWEEAWREGDRDIPI